MPQEDHSIREMNQPEEILWVIFPANDDPTIVMQPREKALDFPATPIAPKNTAILRGLAAARRIVRRNQLHTKALANFGVQRTSVASAIADPSLGSFREEAPLEGGCDELAFMRGSIGHMHGEMKTMAVADCHDFAAVTASSRANGGTPFFAPLKLASVNASLKIELASIA